MRFMNIYNIYENKIEDENLKENSNFPRNNWKNKSFTKWHKYYLMALV